MSINIVLPSSDFNDNTVTFTSDSPGQIKLVGPGNIIDTGKSSEGASGLCPAIFWWSERFIVSPPIHRKPAIYIVQFPPTTWQPGETVTVDGPTTNDDKTVLTLTGTVTTRPQPFVLTEYESLSTKEKADIAEAEGANWWPEGPYDSSA